MQEELQVIKKQFMTYRNGVVADTLRAAGMDCYRIIFGLNLPQLSAIARELKERHKAPELLEIARLLEQDKGVRESRLLAYQLYGMAQVSREEAGRLMLDVQSREEAEVLCLRVLGRHPEAPRLYEAADESTPLQAHLKRVLARHLE